jgi:hypothetical protein
MKARRPAQLPRWHEWSIYLLFGALLISGLGWLVLDKWVRVAGEFGPEHHPAQHQLIIVHGIVAYLFLLSAGALIPVHVKGGWAIGRNRVTGIALASVLGITALTALALYYVGGEEARSLSSLLHWVIGLLAFPALAIHIIRGLALATPRQAASRRRQGRPKRAG